MLNMETIDQNMREAQDLPLRQIPLPSVPVACAGYSSELRCFHASLFSTHVSDCPGKLLAPFPKSTMIHL